MTAIAYTLHSPTAGRYVVRAACRHDVTGEGASPGDALQAWLTPLYAALSACTPEEAARWRSPAAAGEATYELPLTVRLKFELHLHMARTGVSQGELARRLGVSKQEAHRICTLAFPTKIETIVRAFSAVGLALEFVLRPLAEV